MSTNPESKVGASGKVGYGDPDTRRRILDAAWRGIAESGDLTLAGVAAAAGVSRQAIYLHFDDRTGLLLGLVQHMDDSLGLGESIAEVFAAPTGAEAMHRAIVVHSTFNPGIDSVARVLEAVADPADPLAVAWNDRMRFRFGVHREIVSRIDADGALAAGWTIDRAAELFHAVTLPATWRALTGSFGWTAEDYVEHLVRLLGDSLLAR